MTLTINPRTRASAFNVYANNCPSRSLLNLVTGRWAILIIMALADGPVRFGSLRRKLEGISQKVLADKLHELEDEGLITRSVMPKPLAVSYALTPLGETLLQPLGVLTTWAQTHCDEPALNNSTKSS